MSVSAKHYVLRPPRKVRSRGQTVWVDTVGELAARLSFRRQSRPPTRRMLPSKTPMAAETAVSEEKGDARAKRGRH